jgi:hypothetical protein
MSDNWRKVVSIQTTHISLISLCTDVSIQTPHIRLISEVHVSLSRIHTSVWQVVYSCVHIDSIYQSDILCTNVSIRRHTTVWQRVYRYLHTNYKQQSDILCIVVSIQNPQISLKTVVQLCPYRLNTSVWHFVYRWIHTDSTHQSDNWCIKSPYILHTSVWLLLYRCVQTDSSHESDNLYKDVSIETPHFSLISWYRYLHRD